MKRVKDERVRGTTGRTGKPWPPYTDGRMETEYNFNAKVQCKACGSTGWFSVGACYRQRTMFFYCFKCEAAWTEKIEK